MTDTTDLLRRAAAKIRDTAEAAAHGGRYTWTASQTLGSVTPVTVDDTERPTLLIEAHAARYEDVIPHVALWNPHVALAVAEWLEKHADEDHSFLDCMDPAGEEWACGGVITARAITGEDTTT